MALIKCEECGKEISDKAISCPNCGYPLNNSTNIEINPNEYIYNGKAYDLSEVYKYINQNQIVHAIKEFRELTNADLATSKKIVDSLKFNHCSNATNTVIIRCPKCGSDEFEMVRRNWSFLTGFMTNKVDRVCRKCKHKF